MPLSQCFPFMHTSSDYHLQLTMFSISALHRIHCFNPFCYYIHTRDDLYSFLIFSTPQSLLLYSQSCTILNQIPPPPLIWLAYFLCCLSNIAISLTIASQPATPTFLQQPKLPLGQAPFSFIRSHTSGIAPKAHQQDHAWEYTEHAVFKFCEIPRGQKENHAKTEDKGGGKLVWERGSMRDYAE